jgi:hypothetical protein
MDDLPVMGREQLLAELRRAEADLEDVGEMRLFTLGQTGVHLGAGRLQSLQASWDRDEARLCERIAEIKGMLSHAD